MIVNYSEEEIRWHLANNVQPPLSEQAINGIVETVNKVNNGEMEVTEKIHKDTDCTVGEMLTDLKLW